MLRGERGTESSREKEKRSGKERNEGPFRIHEACEREREERQEREERNRAYELALLGKKAHPDQYTSTCRSAYNGVMNALVYALSSTAFILGLVVADTVRTAVIPQPLPSHPSAKQLLNTHPVPVAGIIQSYDPRTQSLIIAKLEADGSYLPLKFILPEKAPVTKMLSRYENQLGTSEPVRIYAAPASNSRDLSVLVPGAEAMIAATHSVGALTIRNIQVYAN
jgi:hypothetical protein